MCITWVGEPMKETVIAPTTARKLTDEEIKKYGKCTGDKVKVAKQYDLTYRRLKGWLMIEYAEDQKVKSCENCGHNG